MASRKDELIISALLANPTVRAASAECKVSETQIYKRLNDPEFKQRYEAARLEILKGTAAAVQHHTARASEVMYEILNNPEASDQVKLNAAEAIFRTSLKLTEQVDIIAKLEQLEKAQADYDDQDDY